MVVFASCGHCARSDPCRPLTQGAWIDTAKVLIIISTAKSSTPFLQIFTIGASWYYNRQKRVLERVGYLVPHSGHFVLQSSHFVVYLITGTLLIIESLESP